MTLHEAQENNLSEPDAQRNDKSYVTGLILLLVVVLLWTSSNYITQGLYQTGYRKPFFVTYLNTASFVLYLIPFVLKSLSEPAVQPQERPLYEPLQTSEEQGQTSNIPLSNDAHILVLSDSNETPLTRSETARLALLFCLLWFIANWSVNSSLEYTSVASSTILSSTSGFFTLVIGRFARVEKLNVIKVIAVITSFCGVVLVARSDQLHPPSPSPAPTIPMSHVESIPLIGDALALISALFYGLYVTLLKVRIGTESRIDMQLFFGFVGLFNLVACWPIIIILHLSGIETFEWPHSGRGWAAVAVNMFITFSSDFIYVLAMLRTTPLVVTIGLSLTIPFAIIGDFVLANPTRIPALIGAALVLISFVVLSIPRKSPLAEEIRIESPES